VHRLVYHLQAVVAPISFVNGKARLIKDKIIWKKHWDESLNQWFKKGIDTPGLVLIAVTAVHIKYWDKYKEGDIELS
jgi:general stress protein 26